MSPCSRIVFSLICGNPCGGHCRRFLQQASSKGRHRLFAQHHVEEKYEEALKRVESSGHVHQPRVGGPQVDPHQLQHPRAPQQKGEGEEASGLAQELGLGHHPTHFDEGHTDHGYVEGQGEGDGSTWKQTLADSKWKTCRMYLMDDLFRLLPLPKHCQI